MGKIIPLILALFGLGGGIGAGLALRPPPETGTEMADCPGTALAEAETPPMDDTQEDSTAPGGDYVKLNNQFVIPVVSDGRVSSLVVMSLSLELNSGGPELVYRMEPKIRDAFLQVLFDHANTGGFDGNFTTGRNMNALRAALLEVARKVLGPVVNSVLIVDVVRQDA